MASGHRRNRLSLAAFSGPSLPLAALGLPLVVYLPEYYAHALGLDLAAVGAAFMMVRLLDIAFDPLLGGLMDRTRTRLGRFRPWLLLVAPILMLGSYQLFMARPGVGPAYLWAWLIVTYVGYSIGVLAQTAWASALSPDYNERSRIYAWWQGANVVGILLVMILATSVSRARPGDLGAGVQAMGWFIIAATPLAIGLAVWKVEEPVLTARPDRAGIGEYLGLLRRASVRRLLAADLALGLAPGITGALFFFFFQQVKHFAAPQAGVLLLLYFLGGLAGGPLWTGLAVRLGKHRALALAGVSYTVLQAGAVMLPPGAFALAAPAMFLAGLPFSAGPFLLRAMMADAGDEERLETGADRTGLLYALLTGTNKIGYALAVGVTFVGLDAFGFSARGSNTPGALLGLEILFGALPAVLGLLAAGIIIGYPLSADAHGAVRARLEERDRAEAPPIIP